MSAELPEHPPFLYGTAWKEDGTRRLTQMALKQGFRGIDTANQRKHYFEAAVGEGIADAMDQGLVTREDIFVQTKFTHLRGQDERLPYDPKAPVSEQVQQSFASSREHLRMDYIDSLVLHGPTVRKGLAAADLDAWKAMEALHDTGVVGHIGVSNVTLEQLQMLKKVARVKPRFAQIRCYATRNWDREMRDFCAANSIVYQGFSLLTANRQVLNDADMKDLARRHNKTPAQVIFRYALEGGMLPITGTRNAGHMAQDLDIFSFQLTVQDRRAIEAMAGEGGGMPFRVTIKRPGAWPVDVH